MSTLKEEMLKLGIFDDNEYLDQYCNLIESNRETKKERFKTQCHHIIPKCYFTLNDLEIDDSYLNKVNLLFKNHILAHSLLILCSNDAHFRYFNHIALRQILGSNNNTLELKELLSYKILDSLQLDYENNRAKYYEYNPMFDKDKKLQHDEIMRSNEVRSKISNTQKRKHEEGTLFTPEHKKHLSECQKGRKCFIKDGKRTYAIKTNTSRIDMLLSTGWTLVCNENKIKNIDRRKFSTRSIKVYCILSTGEKYYFDSMLDAEIWWYNNYKPFGEKFVEGVLRRKMRASIRGERIEYRPWFSSLSKGKKKGEVVVIDNIKWYKLDEDSSIEKGGDNNAE